MKKIYKTSLVTSLIILGFVALPGVKSAQASCSYGYQADALRINSNSGYATNMLFTGYGASSPTDFYTFTSPSGLPSILQIINFSLNNDCYSPSFNSGSGVQWGRQDRSMSADGGNVTLPRVNDFNASGLGMSGDKESFWGYSEFKGNPEDNRNKYQIADIENSVIRGIDKNGGYTININTSSISTPTKYKNTSTFVKATNCVGDEFGKGGDRKVVFLRDNSWNGGLQDFFSAAYYLKGDIAEAERISKGYSSTDFYGKPLNQGLHFYLDLKSWDKSQSATTYDELKSKSSCPGYAVYVLFTKNNYSNSYSISTTTTGYTTGFTDVRAAVFSNDAVVTVGGFMTGLLPFGGIFDWMDKAVSSSTINIHLPFRLTSAAGMANKIRKYIELELSTKHPVIVIGHSLSTFVAFNVHNEYVGNKKVKFIYIDPPYSVVSTTYQIMGTFVGLINRAFGSVSSAINNGIATSPDTVDWTKGSGAPPKNHNPFNNPLRNNEEDTTSLAANGKNNVQNLEALKEKILLTSIVIDDNFGTVSASPTADALTSVPSINGFVDSSGNPITSITPGSTVNIRGNFVAGNGYEIDIQNSSNPNVYYVLYDYAPSADGRTLTFTLPTSYYLADAIGGPATIPGQYDVSVASMSSDLSNVVSITISTSATSNPNNIVSDPIVPNKFKLTWTGLASTGNMVGLTPVSLTGQPTRNSSNTASVWNAVTNFFKSIFGLNKASAQISTGTAMYQISNLSSTNGSVTFTIPSSIPAGVYSVSVAIPGSSWVNTNFRINVVTTTTVTVGGTSTTTIGTTVSSTTGAYTNGARVSAIRSYICPFGWGIVSGGATPTCWGTSLLTPNLGTFGMFITITIPGSGGAIPASALQIPAAPIANCPTVPNGINGVFVRNGLICTFSTTATSTPGTFVSYYCPTGSTLSTTVAGMCVSSTRAACPLNVSLIPGQTSSCSTPAPFLATFIYTCPTGYNLSGSTCNKSSTTTTGGGTTVTTAPVTTTTTTSTTTTMTTSTTTQIEAVPATVSYSCSTGTLSGSNCVSAIAASSVYTCPSGSTLSGTNCFKPDTTGIAAIATYVVGSFISTAPAHYVYSCRSGYTLNATQKKCYNNTPTVTAATKSFSCSTGYTLSGSTCNKTTVATPSYVCPVGYKIYGKSSSGIMMCILNSVAVNNTSTTTANVWDAITNWFGRLFGF